MHASNARMHTSMQSGLYARIYVHTCECMHSCTQMYTPCTTQQTLRAFMHACVHTCPQKGGIHVCARAHRVRIACRERARARSRVLYVALMRP